MSKRKAQFFIDKDKEDEEVLPDVGVINTQQEIQERKILKIRGPKTTNDESKNPKLHITVAPPCFNNTPSTPPKKIESKLFFNTQPLLQLPEQPKSNIGLASPLIEFKCIKKQNDNTLSPVKESDEYILFKYNLKRVTIDSQEHNQNDLLMIVLKNLDQHTIKIEESKNIIIEGKIENNKIIKNEQIVKLECNNKDKLYQIELEFLDIKDYEQFNI